MTGNDRGKNGGVVIRVEGGYCYALARDGRYLRLRIEGGMPKAGELVEVPEGAVASNATPAGRPLHKAVAACALAALVLLAIGISLAAVAFHTQPAAYVAIEINPAIELGLNRAGLVVTTHGTNPDGEAVAETAQDVILHRPAAEAVEAVVRVAGELGYLRTDRDNVVQVSVVAADGYPRVEEEIREKVAGLLEERGFFGYLRVRRAGTTAMRSARAEGLSVNAYLLRQDLESQGIKMTDWGHSVGEILGRVGLEKAFAQDDLVGKRRTPEKGSGQQPGQGGSDRGKPERDNERGEDVKQPRHDGRPGDPSREPPNTGGGGVPHRGPRGTEGEDSPDSVGADEGKGGGAPATGPKGGGKR